MYMLICECLCAQGTHTFGGQYFPSFYMLLRQGISVDPGSYRGLSLPSHPAAGDHLSLWPAAGIIGSHCAHLPFMWLLGPKFLL